MLIIDTHCPTFLFMCIPCLCSIEALPASEMVVLLLRLRTSKLDAYVFAALSFDY